MVSMDEAMATIPESEKTVINGDEYVSIHGVMELAMMSPKTDDFKIRVLSLYQNGEYPEMIKFIVENKGNFKVKI